VAAQIFQLFGEIALKGDQAIIKKLKTVDQAAKSLDESIRDIENKIRIEVDAATKVAQEQIDHLKNEIEQLTRRTHTVKVKADTNPAMGAIMALGPAIVPVIASATVAVGGLTAAFAAAGVGAAAFAAIAIPALSGVFESSKQIEDINKKIAEAEKKQGEATTSKARKAALQEEISLKKELASVTGSLTVKERESLTALQNFKSFWGGFVGEFKNPVLDIFIRSLGTLETVLNQLKPVFESSIAAFSGLFTGIDNAVKSNKMQPFFDWLAENAGPAITNFGTMVGNILKGVADIMMAFGPVSSDMQTGLVGLTQKFADWAAGLSKSQAFKDFIEYVKTNGPTLLTTIKEIITLLIQLTIAFAAVAPVVLATVNGILKFVNFLLQLHPAVGVVAVSIGVLVGAFSFLAPIVTGAIALFTRLGPVFAWLSPILMNARIGLMMFGQAIMGGLRAAFTWLVGFIPRLASGFMGFLRVLNVVRLFLFTNPLGLIIVAIIALVAAGIWLYQNWNTVKVYLIAAWNAIKSFAVGVWNGIKSTIMTTAQAIWSFLVGVWNGIKSTTQSTWNGIKSTISSVWNGIKSFVSSSINSIKSAITSAWNTIKTTTTKAWNSIKTAIGDALSKAYSTVTGYAADFLSAGEGLITALVSGIKNKIGDAVAAVEAGMEKIRGYLPFSPAKEGPLSDLDKSGESFFPTFASRMQKGLSPALGTIDEGLAQARGLIRPVNTSVAPAGAGAGIAPINFSPTYNINGSGMNSVDLRKLMKQIAEEEYNEFQRLQRASGKRGVQ
jgi:phage-related protein